MDAITTQQAERDLDGLIERVITDVQPTILCNDKGNRALLILGMILSLNPCHFIWNHPTIKQRR